MCPPRIGLNQYKLFRISYSFWDTNGQPWFWTSFCSLLLWFALLILRGWNQLFFFTLTCIDRYQWHFKHLSYLVCQIRPMGPKKFDQDFCDTLGSWIFHYWMSQWRYLNFFDAGSPFPIEFCVTSFWWFVVGELVFLLCTSFFIVIDKSCAISLFAPSSEPGTS